MLLLISGPVQPSPGHSSVNFSIALLNASSLNVSDKLSEISILASLYGSDVFDFSEAWLNFIIADESIVIRGYSYPVRKDRVGKRGGRAAIHPKDHIAANDALNLNILLG